VVSSLLKMKMRERELTRSSSHNPNARRHRRSKPVDETNQALRVVVPSVEAESPDHDDRSTILVKVGGRLEDLLIVNLGEERDVEKRGGELHERCSRKT